MSVCPPTREPQVQRHGLLLNNIFLLPLKTKILCQNVLSTASTELRKEAYGCSSYGLKLVFIKKYNLSIAFNSAISGFPLWHVELHTRQQKQSCHSRDDSDSFERYLAVILMYTTSWCYISYFMANRFYPLVLSQKDYFVEYHCTLMCVTIRNFLKNKQIYFKTWCMNSTITHIKKLHNKWNMQSGWICLNLKRLYWCQ